MTTPEQRAVISPEEREALRCIANDSNSGHLTGYMQEVPIFFGPRDLAVLLHALESAEARTERAEKYLDEVMDARDAENRAKSNVIEKLESAEAQRDEYRILYQAANQEVREQRARVTKLNDLNTGAGKRRRLRTKPKSKQQNPPPEYCMNRSELHCERVPCSECAKEWAAQQVGEEK